MGDLNLKLSQLLSKPLFAIPFFVWIFFWKAWALWKAASKHQLIWFILILLINAINTLGLLEIAYIFYLNRWDIDKGKLLAFLEKKFKKSRGR